ncbi:MAG: hypothetical protein KDD84_01720 [Caldilineaceae bacterium]|nr:hypothetical protein [Caldilineaceae bacterium]
MTSLSQELSEVREILSGVTAELHPALSEFIKDEIRRHTSMRLGAIVLAAAFPAEDSPTQREKRVNLAAALELLTVALEIHKLLLLSAGARDSVDRALAGGTVLAGDYCFSRAAALAARTEHPQVIAIFAELLQQLSEGNLRRLFAETDEPFNEEEVLYRSATHAGTTLAGLPEPQIAATLAWISDGQNRVEGSDLVVFQRGRWGEIMRNS